VKRIVDVSNTHPKCTHKQLLQALAPSPISVPPATESPVAAAAEGSSQSSGSIEPTPEMAAVMSDLHWLVHQGHVIEFANGILETAKKPLLKPVKPAPKKTSAAATAESISPVEMASEVTGSIGGETAAVSNLSAAVEESSASAEIGQAEALASEMEPGTDSGANDEGKPKVNPDTGS
jgi:hypothetical protein